MIDLKDRVETLEKDRQEQSRSHSRELARIARMVEQSNSSHRILQMNNRLVEEQILRWSESLSSARVTRWGGVISTPGIIFSVLQRTLVQRVESKLQQFFEDISFSRTDSK